MQLSTQKVRFIKTNLMGEFAHLHANSDPCVQIIFPGGRKLNSEFNLFFHADIHNYITFSIN